MKALKEIKVDIGEKTESTQAMTKEITEKLFESLIKGQDLMHLSITPEDYAEAITDITSEAGDVSPETLAQINQTVLSLFQDLDNGKKNKQG